MKLDSKTIAGVLGALALLAGATSGVLYVSTPEAQKCEVDLASAKTRLELLTERVDLLTDAKDACKVALGTCVVEPR